MYSHEKSSPNPTGVTVNPTDPSTVLFIPETRSKIYSRLSQNTSLRHLFYTFRISKKMIPASNAGFFMCGHSPIFFAERVQRVNAVCQLRFSLLTFSFYYTFQLLEYSTVLPIYLHSADALYTLQFASRFSLLYQHNILCTRILDFDTYISIHRIAHTALLYFFLSSIP